MADEEEQLANVHPGEVLKEDFLVPMGMTAYRLAKEMGVKPSSIYELVAGKRSVTVAVALRLSKYFGTTPEFWMNLQNLYDLEEKQRAEALKEMVR